MKILLGLLIIAVIGAGAMIGFGDQISELWEDDDEEYQRPSSNNQYIPPTHEPTPYTPPTPVSPPTPAPQRPKPKVVSHWSKGHPNLSNYYVTVHAVVNNPGGSGNVEVNCVWKNDGYADSTKFIHMYAGEVGHQVDFTFYEASFLGNGEYTVTAHSCYINGE